MGDTVAVSGKLAQKCSARTTRSKQPCRAWAVAGTNVCQAHGGSAPQVRRKARERLAALVDPALDTLQSLLKRADSDSVRLNAVREVLDRVGITLEPTDDDSAQVVQAMQVTINFEKAEGSSSAYIDSPLSSTTSGALEAPRARTNGHTPED